MTRHDLYCLKRPDAKRRVDHHDAVNFRALSYTTADAGRIAQHSLASAHEGVAARRGAGRAVMRPVPVAAQQQSERTGADDQAAPGTAWRFGGARGRTDVPKIVDWYMGGKIEIDPMITHTLPLERINEAFELMHSGESIRSVVVY